MKTNGLALMETTSFCAGVRHKRYSGQQETASKKIMIDALNTMIFCTYTIQNTLFRYIYTTNLLL